MSLLTNLISGTSSGTSSSFGIIGGSDQNDFLYGNLNKSDTIMGFGGDDTIYGDGGSSANYFGYNTSNNDLINGGSGNDVIFGELGSDTLQGGTGDDFIFGGGTSPSSSPYFNNESPDYITGGAGNDTLVGSIFGQGSPQYPSLNVAGDTLIGGSGNDLFVIGGFGPFSGSSGGNGDIVVYKDGEDKIGLVGIEFENLKFAAYIDPIYGGTNTLVLGINNQVVATLINTNPSQLTASDFIIF